MTRREEKKDLTQKQILSAAATLFAENGYDSTSIDDIAAKANIAKGTLYYHFDSKESVVVALREDSFSEMLQNAMHSLSLGEKPVNILEKVLLERAAWTEKNPDLTKVFFEQRMHRWFFRENDPILAGSASQVKTKEYNDNHDTNGSSNGKEKDIRTSDPSNFTELIKVLVMTAQRDKELRQDLSAVELSQMIIAMFLHAQGSWLGGYSSTSLIDKVHRWFHALLDGLYA
jgi:AcrR family transcriptional regulator